MIGYLKNKYGLLRLKKKFWNEYKELKKQEALTEPRFQFEKENVYPFLWDNTGTTDYDHHYVLHTAWGIRKIIELAPKKHIDISSSLYFCCSLSAFIPVEFFDYRPADIRLNNLKTSHADITALHFESNSISSLSCMHTVEHIGLGRYGDPIDYNGDLKAIKELKRVLAKNGTLLFVVPIGNAKIEFNGQRLYTYKQVLNYFNEFDLMEFSLISDNDKGGHLIINASEDEANSQKYGCGCFLFKK